MFGEIVSLIALWHNDCCLCVHGTAVRQNVDYKKAALRRIEDELSSGEG